MKHKITDVKDKTEINEITLQAPLQICVDYTQYAFKSKFDINLGKCRNIFNVTNGLLFLLNVSYFRNVFLVSSILPKNEQTQFDLRYHSR